MIVRFKNDPTGYRLGSEDETRVKHCLAHGGNPDWWAETERFSGGQQIVNDVWVNLGEAYLFETSA